MNFKEAVDALKADLIAFHPRCAITISVNSDVKRWQTVKKIEAVAKDVIKSITMKEMPIIESLHCTSSDGGGHTNNRLNPSQVRPVKITINFGKEKKRLRFVIIVFLLSKIHKLLTTSKTCTRRELYYKNLKVFRSQKQVDDNVKHVSYILNAPSWELGVLATSKGLVFGPLLLYFKNGESINCNKRGGVAVPHNISDVETLSSSAEWVLIIEKDTCFQRIIDGEAFSRLGSCIVITGKGFPDVSTRMLVCKFWEHLQIPILALNDADPYGFEIMCVYRFGSKSMSSHTASLACPAIRWLGVHPSDIKPLLLDNETLSERDVRKINCIMERSYVKENYQLKKQMEILLKQKVKAEIEGLTNISTNYLVDVYVKSKIQCKDYF